MHKLELTDRELFVLRIALGEVQGIRDGEYRTVVEIAEGIERRLPRPTTVWADVEYSGDN